MLRLRPALKKINCVSCESGWITGSSPDEHSQSGLTYEPLGGPPGSVLTSIDISRRSFLNIQTLYQKAMSHCLNEVKVSLLLIAEIIIVVCPWDEKGKFSKIFKKIET